MKFAFLMVGNFDCELTEQPHIMPNAQIIGVANIEEACTVAKSYTKNELTTLSYAVHLVKLGQK